MYGRILLQTVCHTRRAGEDPDRGDERQEEAERGLADEL